MTYHQIDVNRQIKEKLMLFQEIDKNAIAKSNPFSMNSGLIEKIDVKENLSKTDLDNKIKTTNQSDYMVDKSIRNQSSEYNKFNSFNKRDFTSNESNSFIKSTNNLSGNAYNTNNSKNEAEKIKSSKDLTVSYKTNIDAKKFLTNNNNTINRSNKKINLDKNLLPLNQKTNQNQTNNISTNSYNKFLKKEKNNQKNNSKENKLNRSSNTINDSEMNSPNFSPSLPIRSILKNGSREKLKNSSSILNIANNNDEKFIKLNDSNSINSEFVRKNKHIMFNDIESKIIPKNENKPNLIDYNKEFVIKDINPIIKTKIENIDKNNSPNTFSYYESPIKNYKDTNGASSFIVEGDGMSNIMLNKEKNFNIINLDKLYQGSFNKEFCELYGNSTNIPQNDSTMHKSIQNTQTTTNFTYKKPCYDTKSINEIKSFENNPKEIKTNNNNNNNNNVPIQELNKFFTKRASTNNLNYFTSKKPESSKSNDYYSTNDKNKLNSIDGAYDNQVNFNSKNSFDINLIPAYANSNQKNIDNSNRKELYTFNNNQHEEIIRNQTFNENQNNNMFNNNHLIEEVNPENFEESYFRKLNSKTPCQNVYGNNICNYADYNSPFTNKEGDPKYVDKLSSFHFVYKNKVEKLRREEFEKRCKSSNPQITKKAKKIIREGHLFHCRLYPYHKIPKSTVFKNSNNTVRNTYYNHNHNNININNIFYYNSANNCSTASYIVENLRRLEGIEDIKTYKIYRTSKNQDYLNLSNNNNENKGLNHSFNNISRPYNNLNSSLKSSLCENIFNSYNNSTIINKPNNINKSFDLNEKSKQLNRSFNDLIYNNNPFTFKPKLNNKSLNIAEKLTPAYLRLTEKSRKSRKLEEIKNDEIIIQKIPNSVNQSINPNSSYDAISPGKGLYGSSKNKNNSRSNSKGEFNRSFDLYRKGVQRLKKKNVLHIQKIINDEECYKQFPFKPKINENYPAMLLAAKEYKRENIDNPNDRISNVHNINYGIYLNKDNFKKNLKTNKNQDKDNLIKSNLINSNKEKNSQLTTKQVTNIYYKKLFPDEFFSNHSEFNDNNNNVNIVRNNSISFYDKNIYWKKNLQKKFNKLKDEKEEELKNLHTFKPEIHRVPLASDNKFIEKNINQIQEYVNKRRSCLQKSQDDIKYKNSKYHYGENFKIKTTIPQEFNLSYKVSKDKILSKTATSFYGANDDKENLSAFQTKNSNNKSNSKDTFNLKKIQKNKKNKNYDVQNLRQNYKINEFFEFDEVITADSARESNQNKKIKTKKSNSNLFCKNSNLLNKNLNNSFNNLSNKKNVNKQKLLSYNHTENENFDNENYQNKNYGCEINNSEQTHNNPKDIFYHSNNLNDYNMFNHQNYFTNIDQKNNYYSNKNMNFYDPSKLQQMSNNQLNEGNLMDPKTQQYSNNIQVNNFFVDNTNMGFPNQQI